MIKNIQQSFSITNKYMILATPLILFSLLSSLYILFSLNGKVIGLLFAVVLFFLMSVAFCSGWFYMVKNAIADSEPDEPNALIKDFLAGVGEFFVPVSGMALLVVFISAILFVISYFVGMKFIGEIGIPAESFVKAMESTANLKAFILSLSETQIIKINAWNLLIFAITNITCFMLMFYPPALFYKTKNPIYAYLNSLKNLFSRKFFSNVFLYIFLSVAYLVLSLFTSFLGHNIFLHFIFTLVNFYYIVFATTLVFYYYYNNFIKTGNIIDKIL